MKVEEDKKRIGVIRWAVLLSTVTTFFAVLSFLIVGMMRRYFYGSEDESLLLWSTAIYQIMGALNGITVAVISTMLYRRMVRLLDGLKKVSEGDFSVQIPLQSSGEYRVLYDTFNQMVRELKQADMQQKNFINDFSHEFKTPITSIKGFADYLCEHEVSEELRQYYLHAISEEAARLAGLSQTTLLLSRLETWEIMREKETYRLDDQIRRCLILLLPECERKQIIVETNLCDITYHGNKDMMAEVWVNLVDNAIKYTPEGGTIQISLQKSEEVILITVADSGIGMSEEVVSHMFEKYYQGDKDHATKGYGLGLAIV